jgi:hypothetical protein
MRIVSFGQQVMLDDQMTVINQITVELPDGRQVSVPASEETVQSLMKLHAGVPVETEVYVPQPANYVNLDQETFQEEDEEGVDPGEIGAEAVMGRLSEVPAATSPVGAIGQVRQAPRPSVDADGFMIAPKARTVPKDELGYPIVQKRSAPPQQRQLAVDDDGEQI